MGKPGREMQESPAASPVRRLTDGGTEDLDDADFLNSGTKAG